MNFYDEPTVMWRMCRPNGLRSHAVITPLGEILRVTWYLNELTLGTREFHDAASAIRWTEQLQFQNWAAGWRPASDVDPEISREQPER